ncbi:MAG: hypothetical protein R6V44_17370 [Paracoccaceae bacterium]
MRPAFRAIFALTVAGTLAACAQQTADTAAATTSAWNTQQGDAPLNAEELTALVSDRELTYEDGSRSLVEADGDYTYVAPNGARFFWTWQATPEGAICLANERADARCDLLVRNGDAVISVNEQGKRFEIVEIAEL